MKKRIIIIVSLILVIALITLCIISFYNNKRIEQELNDAQELYLVYLNGKGLFGNQNKFQLYNENGKLIKEETFKGNNLSYEYVNNTLIHFAGLGGLYEFNIDTLSLQKLSNKNINIVKFYDDEMYYYDNENYQICYNDNCIDVDMIVGDFVIKDNYLYVLGQKLKIYENNELIEEFDYSDEKIITKIYNLNNKLLIINEYKILEIDGTTIKELTNINEEEELIYYQDENDANYIFDFGNQELMFVDLKENNEYDVKEKIDITNITQANYDFTINSKIYYTLDLINTLTISDLDRNVIKAFEIKKADDDTIYSVYKIRRPEVN